jgi:hypothetical protein
VADRDGDGLESRPGLMKTLGLDVRLVSYAPPPSFSQHAEFLFAEFDENM